MPGRSMSLTIRSQSRPLMISNACSALDGPADLAERSPAIPRAGFRRPRRLRRGGCVPAGPPSRLPSSLKGSGAIMALVASYSPPPAIPSAIGSAGAPGPTTRADRGRAGGARRPRRRAARSSTACRSCSARTARSTASFDLAGGDPAGRCGRATRPGSASPRSSGAATGSARHERLIAGVARWLLDHARRDIGLVRGGPDVSWVSTEHNLEARALFAGLGAVDVSRRWTARSTPSSSPATASARASATTPGRVDVQAYGILWLIGRDRHADAAAVERTTDATMRVDGRRVLWPGRPGRPSAATARSPTRGPRTCCGWRAR